jgi:Cu/Ag efflux protein CusF
MKKWLPYVTFAFLATAVSAGQETTPPKEGAAQAQRQFTGEVVSADVAAKTLTVKASGLDSSGQQVEKTMGLAVADSAINQLEGLKAGDKVTVLWQRDDAAQKDVVVAINKATPPSDASKQ